MLEKENIKLAQRVNELERLLHEEKIKNTINWQIIEDLKCRISNIQGGIDQIPELMINLIEKDDLINWLKERRKKYGNMPAKEAIGRVRAYRDVLEYIKNEANRTLTLEDESDLDSLIDAINEDIEPDV